MAFTGPDPKDRTRRAQTGEWTEVANVVFDGPERLELPTKRGMKWAPEVARWWEVTSRMPHCCLWQASDWVFALETAYMKNDWWADFVAGKVAVGKSTEIRRREAELGTTAEHRRKLRIRYTGTVAVSTEAPAGVTDLAERRRRMTGA